MRKGYFPKSLNNNPHDGKEVVKSREQNLVDCVAEGTGCYGGWMKDAFNFIKVRGGIHDGDSYPYDATKGRYRFKKDKVAVYDSGAAVLPVDEEESDNETSCGQI